MTAPLLNFWKIFACDALATWSMREIAGLILAEWCIHSRPALDQAAETRLRR